MKTLYDLLGALPDDDAESLRTAFRNAVKATHPDINGGDPDASLRFRRIVRANAILSDPEQRAGYDRLLALALRRPDRKRKRTFISHTMRKIASDAIAVAVLSAVSIGGYTLFVHISNASVIPPKVTDVTARGWTEIAAVIPTEPIDKTGRDEPRDKRDGAEVVKLEGGEVAKLEGAEVAKDAIAPKAVAPAASAGGTPAIANAGPTPDLAAHDAKSYRDRGIFAYREGDLYRAIADFDRAIQHNPSFAGAYIDRGIVFYRMREFDRAFADIAQAKRIENSNRTKPPLPAPHKASPSSGKK